VPHGSAFSFKGKRADAKAVAKDLNVGFVIDGTVRRVGSHLKVTAELIDAKDGLARWSNSWDRQTNDIFSVQDEITRAVIGALRIRIPGNVAARLTNHGTSSVEAHELYLRGRFFASRFDEVHLKQALELYRKALVIDSNYALAHTGVADALVNLADNWLPPRLAYPQARKAAQRALELDETSAEAHTGLATVLMWYDWDRAGAERELNRAIHLNPNYPRAHFYLGRLRAFGGDIPGGLIEMREAQRLVP
jgi:tetratricopeptide (TPR) repeat protein